MTDMDEAAQWRAIVMKGVKTITPAERKAIIERGKDLLRRGVAASRGITLDEVDGAFFVCGTGMHTGVRIPIEREIWWLGQANGESFCMAIMGLHKTVMRTHPLYG